MSEQKSILIVYTGGTIGMKENPETGALAPFNFNQILDEVPELRKFGFNLDTISFNPLVDSSDITPTFWISLAEIVEQNYQAYDGFVILHGTDTRGKANRSQVKFCPNPYPSQPYQPPHF